MVMLIQTVMLSEKVPVLLTRLTVTDPSLSLTVTLAVSNSMVTTGTITGQITVHLSSFSCKNLYALIIIKVAMHIEIVSK